MYSYDSRVGLWRDTTRFNMRKFHCNVLNLVSFVVAHHDSHCCEISFEQETFARLCKLARYWNLLLKAAESVSWHPLCTTTISASWTCVALCKSCVRVTQKETLFTWICEAFFKGCKLSCFCCEDCRWNKAFLFLDLMHCWRLVNKSGTPGTLFLSRIEFAKSHKWPCSEAILQNPSENILVWVKIRFWSFLYQKCVICRGTSPCNTNCHYINIVWISDKKSYFAVTNVPDTRLTIVTADTVSDIPYIYIYREPNTVGADTLKRDWVGALPDASTPSHLLPHHWTYPVHFQWMWIYTQQWGICNGLARCTDGSGSSSACHRGAGWYSTKQIFRICPSILQRFQMCMKEQISTSRYDIQKNSKLLYGNYTCHPVIKWNIQCFPHLFCKYFRYICVWRNKPTSRKIQNCCIGTIQAIQ